MADYQPTSTMNAEDTYIPVTLLAQVMSADEYATVLGLLQGSQAYQLLMNQSNEFTFGKYKGTTLQAVMGSDQQYVKWVSTAPLVLENHPGLAEEARKLLN